MKTHGTSLADGTARGTAGGSRSGAWTVSHRVLQCALVGALLPALASAQGNAQGGTAPSAAALRKDTLAIQTLLAEHFGQPDVRVTVDPVSIEGSVAIAAWQKEGHGGRTLLFKQHGGWTIQSSGGNRMLLESTLTGAGVAPALAHSLIEKEKAAELRYPTAVLFKFAAFDESQAQ